MENIRLVNRAMTIELSGNGCAAKVLNNATGVNMLDGQPAFAYARKGDTIYHASGLQFNGASLNMAFKGTPFHAEVTVDVMDDHMLFTVARAEGAEADELCFMNLPLAEYDEDAYAASIMALNLKTRVDELPGVNRKLTALCYARFGFAGAAAAILITERPALRDHMKAVLSSPASEIPVSPLGGPWAMDGDICKGSYCIETAGFSAEDAPQWINMAKPIGIGQIDFHCSHDDNRTFRFGDLQPCPRLYPGGTADVKRLIELLHEAGIKVGLHTYATFISKQSVYVTPMPDHRLGYFEEYTLSEALSETAGKVFVEQSTAGLSLDVGFFYRNSVTIRIDDELIEYKRIASKPPFGFFECVRGAHGTTPACHDKGAPAYRLKECFGLFTPSGDSDFLDEVAARTAEFVNACDFDMIYFDALDGGDILEGVEWRWHYEPKFIFEVAKRLKKPALLEYSSMGHHLWYLRSRMNAWDHANRHYKSFIDLHCAENQRTMNRQLMRTQLGWWDVDPMCLPNNELTTRMRIDDIEYWCAKALGFGSGLSFLNINLNNASSHFLNRANAVISAYEPLRLRDYFGQATCEMLKEPGQDYKLLKGTDGEYFFTKIRFFRKALDAGASARICNPYVAQKPLVRLEPMYNSISYEKATENPDLLLFSAALIGDFAESGAMDGVRMEMKPAEDERMGAVRIYAKNNAGAAGWCFKKNVLACEKKLGILNAALGFWVCGDGSGALLNLKLDSTDMYPVWDTKYVAVDFVGWRYFLLTENDSGSLPYGYWPYEDEGFASLYAVYRTHLDYNRVCGISVWLGNIPAGGEADICVSPIYAMPRLNLPVRDPSVIIGGKTLTFLGEFDASSQIELMPDGSCLEYRDGGCCERNVQAAGEIPVVDHGDVEIGYLGGSDVTSRAELTLRFAGEKLAPIKE